MPALDSEFHRRVVTAAQQCRDDFGYNPTYWLRMIQEHGSIDAAKRLLLGPRASDGFTRLWEEGRLDLSVEFFVLMPEFSSMFTAEELMEARRRLELYEFDVDVALRSPSLDEVVVVTTHSKAEPGPREVDDKPEAPVVKRMAAPSTTAINRPERADLERARAVFGTREPRDVFYRAATDLVKLALADQASISLSEALAVLLQTWNRAFYQYRKPDMAKHFEELDAVLGSDSEWLKAARARSIDSFQDEDEAEVIRVFQDFEAVLGPVGAAKALHLLAPRFAPLWDRAITIAYGLELGAMGTNGSRYVRFMRIVKEQSDHLGGHEGVGRNVLKALDEYNYCHFSRGWI
jgi:hypothetical protein